MAANGPVRGWQDARLHIVTGKGGTGKTTAAAAMALALASGGQRTLLVEVEGRQGLAQLFDVPPLPYGDRKIAVPPGGGEVYALAVDAEEALLEYLDMFYRLGRAGRMLKRLGAIDFATTIAPGVRDVLLTGKIKEATTRVEKGRRAYHRVVLDAPPTGRISRFLNVTAEVAGLTKVGPIKSQAEGVAALLRSPMAAVHVVTTLEEMPVQETLDAVAELRRLELSLGTVIVNMTRPELLADATVTRESLRRGLAAAGLPTDRDMIGGLLREVAEHQAQLRRETRLREELGSAGRPVLELPFLSDGIDLSGLFTLADTLSEYGLYGH
ncbi:MAG TPA: ArsA-related P-loop ATPase [Micromonosporaceae bacterium]|nr:ArsA-related P-loop ATPase [Micromonosporaceae bacterium]